jgi:hypothetical protein
MDDRYSLENLRKILDQVEKDFKASEVDEAMVEIYTRPNLEEDECCQLVDWLHDLPNRVWSDENKEQTLLNLLESRQALVVLHQSMESEIVYFKLKWG